MPTNHTPNSPYEAHLMRVADRRGLLAETVRRAVAGWNPLTLEMGCGHGHYLSAYAAAHPHAPCLGIDLVTKRVARANAKAAKRNLNNLTFIKAEVSELLEVLPQDIQLERVFMLFPDPWPKARHHKHRMVQPKLLTAVAARARAGAGFYFRTDHSGYFDWTRGHFEEHPDWHIRPNAPWPFEAASFFQELMDGWQSLVARRA